MFHDSNFDYQKNIVRGEVELIIGMNTLHVIGGNVGLIMYKFTVVLLAPCIGRHDPNL